MENFEGLLSLFLTSIELVLILNLLYHSEKNKINILSLSLLTLLFSYQFVEFIICGLGIRTSFLAYSALLTVSFMPPLSLYIALKFWNFNRIVYYLIFLPAIFFGTYYLLVIDEFVVTKCTVIYASYNYPLGFLYGVFYYLPILITILLLGYKNYNNTVSNKTKLNQILFWGFSITFIPGFIFTRVVPGMLQAVESILCSFAFILFLFISYFIHKNRKIEHEL
jgi:hypothetical protein